MENQNKNTRKYVDQPESLSDSQQKSSGKSKLDIMLELFLIDIEISTIKRDIELCMFEDMPDQRKILLEGYSLLLNKRNEIIKEI